MSEVRRVLFFGSYDARLHPRVGVLRDGLRSAGFDVDELNEPLGASTSAKVEAAGSTSAAVQLLLMVLRCWARLMRRSRRVKRPDVVVVGYMGHLDVHLARVLFPKAVIVLDHLVGLGETVRDRGLGGGAKLRILAAIDHAALRAADVVVVDTAAQAEALPSDVAQRIVVVPVGADQAWTDAADRAVPRDPSSPLRVVFFGLYTPLQGAVTIGEAIRRLSDTDIEFTMIGHGQDFTACKARAADNHRVEWIEWVDPAELPDIVARHDVCLGIFGAGPKTQRVVPTKVYQGLAAGCGVITGDTPAARDLLDGEVVVVPVDDPEALAAELRELTADRARLTMLRHRARSLAEQFEPAAATAGLATRMAAPSMVRRPLMPPLALTAALRWDLIRGALDRIRASNVLEIGPGEGAIACRLAGRYDYTGVELSNRTRWITEKRLIERGTPGRLLGSLDDLDPGEQFDLVVTFEVIEHIEDDDTALTEWFERVRPGGTFILSTPAGSNRMGPADVAAGHHRRYDPPVLARKLADAGFAEVNIWRYGFPAANATLAIRNFITARQLAGHDADLGDADATEQSSSFLQPPDWAGPVMAMVSWPATRIQRAFEDRGPGLVALARVPE
jgi:2-polyprenyl-3-methyl-5-hydroxy-6-metoxy-1,4-benzoquinol methylase